MADQQSRGGKKAGTGKGAGSHQGVNTTKPRPAEGQPGGPKQNTGKTRTQNG